MTAAGRATATACSNIALAKYWGKADAAQNLPAVPSLSLTLAGLQTRTTVTFDPTLRADELFLNGSRAESRPLARTVALLADIRERARLASFARVESENDFPTAAGLASSASGFAALALAATRASGLDLADSAVSAIARRASASAARSLFGGFAVLEAGATSAQALNVPAWPLRMLVAVVTAGTKATSSTSGMLHTQDTSPFYASWLAHAPGIYAEIRAAVLDRDFTRLGCHMEHSALSMHASMLAAIPALVYFQPATIAAMDCVKRLRAKGTEAYFTIDAGPNVKVLVEEASEREALAALRDVPGVEQVLQTRPGPGATSDNAA